MGLEKACQEYERKDRLPGVTAGIILIGLSANRPMTEVVTRVPHFTAMEVNTVNTQWTDERIIDLVRNLRNDLIKDFLDERNLKEYMATHYRISDLSAVKIEFIKRDLKELLISPVNIGYYEPLINHIRTTDSAAVTETYEPLFYKELEDLFKRYIYQ